MASCALCGKPCRGCKLTIEGSFNSKGLPPRAELQRHLEPAWLQLTGIDASLPDSVATGYLHNEGTPKNCYRRVKGVWDAVGLEQVRALPLLATPVAGALTPIALTAPPCTGPFAPQDNESIGERTRRERAGCSTLDVPIASLRLKRMPELEALVLGGGAGLSADELLARGGSLSVPLVDTHASTCMALRRGAARMLQPEMAAAEGHESVCMQTLLDVGVGHKAARCLGAAIAAEHGCA